MHEWILDNDCTPYLIVEVIDGNGAEVPVDFVKDEQIVLNISTSAVRQLHISNDSVTFDGRFQGAAHHIVAPIGTVLGIIARENGEGMWFPREKEEPPEPPSDTTGGSKPTLKVVK